MAGIDRRVWHRSKHPKACQTKLYACFTSFHNPGGLHSTCGSSAGASPQAVAHQRCTATPNLDTFLSTRWPSLSPSSQAAGLASADVVYGSGNFGLPPPGATAETATVLILRNEMRTHRRTGVHDGRQHQCGPCPDRGRQPGAAEPDLLQAFAEARMGAEANALCGTVRAAQRRGQARRAKWMAGQESGQRPCQQIPAVVQGDREHQNPG
jgi:hypothetical protein